MLYCVNMKQVSVLEYTTTCYEVLYEGKDPGSGSRFRNPLKVYMQHTLLQHYHS